MSACGKHSRINVNAARVLAYSFRPLELEMCKHFCLSIFFSGFCLITLFILSQNAN